MNISFVNSQTASVPSPSARPAIGCILLAALAALSLVGCSVAPPPGAKPVTGFEVDRYLGTWYEIARLDHRFERDLEAVTAQYAPRDDGGITVTNRGWHTQDGEWKEARGKAFFQGDPGTASLKVSFFGPFYGGYHVLALDASAPDYGFAMIAGPSREYLWILSRTPKLPPETLERLITQARALDFPLDQLVLVDQSRHAGD